MSNPFRRPPRLKVTDTRYEIGDLVTTANHRWIIRYIHPTNDHVVLDAADASIRWTTQLSILPPKVTQ